MQPFRVLRLRFSAGAAMGPCHRWRKRLAPMIPAGTGLLMDRIEPRVACVPRVRPAGSSSEEVRISGFCLSFHRPWSGAWRRSWMFCSPDFATVTFSC